MTVFFDHNLPHVMHHFSPSLTRSQESIWDDGCMQKALQAVKLDGASVRRAAKEYGVPKSTLGTVLVAG